MSVIEKRHGAVYTRPWVVKFLLDLAGYRATLNLSQRTIVEPSIGSGAFVVEIAERLVLSCRSYGVRIADCEPAVVGYERNPAAAEMARTALEGKLRSLKVAPSTARKLAGAWVRVGDYLLDAHSSPDCANFVVGNPPYVRLENIEDRDNQQYRQLFSTMKGRADVYVAFFEAALRQLCQDGVCAFICADRWMFNQYGRPLREFITSNFSVDTVLEFHNVDAFESEVSAYPAITIIRRGAKMQTVIGIADQEILMQTPEALCNRIESFHRNCASRLDATGVKVYRSQLPQQSGEPWHFSSPARMELLRRLEHEFPLLEAGDTETRVGIGVATGRDEVYITQDRTIVEASRLLPLAIGDDTVTGNLQWSRHFLVNPWNRDGLVDLEDYPKLKTYFEKNQKVICDRNCVKRRPDAWFKTIDRVDLNLLTTPKLYIPDIKNTIHPVLDTGATYPHHNLYYVRSGKWDLEVLGALLMSAVGNFFVECYGVRMRGGFLRMQAQYLRRIRVPSIKSLSRAQGEQLRRAFRNRDVAMATRFAFQVYGIDGIPA